MLKLRSIILIAFLVLGVLAPGLVALGTTPPNQSSCRVTTRPVGWPGGLVEQRTLQPYVGTAPLTNIEVDACVASIVRVAVENMTVDDFCMAQWVHGDMRFEAAFDPGFSFKFVDHVLTHPTIGFVLSPFDGAFDFEGLSGTRHEDFKQALIVSSFPVKDEAFFRQPFTIWIRMTSPDGVVLLNQGHMTSEFDQLGSVGITFRFNGVAPPK